MIAGIAVYTLHFSAVNLLLTTTIFYGITAPLLISIILHIANNKKIMGNYVNNKLSNIIGIATLIIMATTIATLAVCLF